MNKKTYTDQQIIGKLIEAYELLSQGFTIVDVSKKLGITAKTYYRWRKIYARKLTRQIQILRRLEKENVMLESGNDMPPWATDGKNISNVLYWQDNPGW